MILTQVSITDGKFSRVYEGSDTEITRTETDTATSKITQITIIEYHDTPVFLRG